MGEIGSPKSENELFLCSGFSLAKNTEAKFEIGDVFTYSLPFAPVIRTVTVCPGTTTI